MFAHERIEVMSQSSKMNHALKQIVIKPLLDIGFTGEFPHFRKVYDNRIELLVIEKNKWGNSFTIEISTIYPQYADNERNFANWKDSIDDVNVWDTFQRYRLPGMYDGWFYYTDVYAKWIPSFGKDYVAVSETKKQEFIPPKGYKQVQAADDFIYEKICYEVNKQMKKAFEWWKKMA